MQSKRKTMYPLSYHQSVNDLIITHALGHMMYGYTLLVPMNQRVLKKSCNDHNKIKLLTQFLDFLELFLRPVCI